MTEVTQADRKMEPCPWCGKQPVYCPDTSYGEETVFCPDRNECPASPSTYGPVGSGEAITAWNSHRTAAEAAKDARIKELEAKLAKARESFRHISKQWPDSFAARSARAALKASGRVIVPVEDLDEAVCTLAAIRADRNTCGHYQELAGVEIQRLNKWITAAKGQTDAN